MKRKRYLKPSIEKVITVITFTLFIFTGSIDDFEISFLPIYLGLWAIVYLNILILHKYGKGVWLEKDE